MHDLRHHHAVVPGSLALVGQVTVSAQHSDDARPKQSRDERVIHELRRSDQHNRHAGWGSRYTGKTRAGGGGGY